ncbi:MULTISPECIES: hypothetical protein [Actinosynnema]|uniref:hypothetical protein n=1 Tax=Actinosynnema TaxID=40566 RepID=UPI0020A35D5E|nr:hypothetical protein [Actinosynnema pretiosum]
MTLLDHPGHDLRLVGETLLAAGRPGTASRYLAAPRRAKSDVKPVAAFFGEVSTIIGKTRKFPPRWPCRLSPELLLAVCRAQEALGRLDETTRRSPLGPDWGLAVRLREARQLAHLHGVHASLREVWQTHLPGNMPRIATEPALTPHLHSILANCPKHLGPPPDRTVPQVVSATLWHLQALDADLHTAFNALPELLVRGGALRDTWLPLLTAITTHPDDYLTALRTTAETGSADPLVAHIAHSVVTACQEEIALVDRLTALREQLLAAASPGRTGRILKVVASLPTAPVLNNLRVVQQHGITVKAATSITATLVDHGLLVPHPCCTRSAVFCKPQALYLHSGLPTNPA